MLDDIDFRLLKILQETALQTAQELGDALNLSASQAGRRRQRLEQQGYIKGFHATLNSERLGLNVQAFIQVSMVTHSAETAKAFQTLLKSRHEVVSAWTLTGEADYLFADFLHRSQGAKHPRSRSFPASFGGSTGAESNRDGANQGGFAAAAVKNVASCVSSTASEIG